MSAELNGNLTPEEQLTGALDTSAQLVGSLNTGSGGTDDYNDLSNKPKINNVTLSGNKTTADLHISYSDLEDKPTIPAAQVNSDWNSSSGVSEILNKPTIPHSLSDLSDVDVVPGYLTDLDYLMWDEGEGKWIAAHGITDLNDLNDVSAMFHLANGQVLQYGNGVWFNNFVDYSDITNTPTIPAAQVNSDWNSSSGVSEILNKPTLATVATSGSYNDLSNKPLLPDFSTTNPSSLYTVTKTEGEWSFDSIWARKAGNIIYISMYFKGSGNVVNAGSNAFKGTLSGGPLPIGGATLVSYIDAACMVCTINSSGGITIRITGSSVTLASTNTAGFQGLMLIATS